MSKNKQIVCPFCDIDYNDISNTIIEETDNFIIVPSKGAIVVGYLLVVPKQHITSINELNISQKEELKNLLDRYRKLFFVKFGKYPIIFEHGTSSNHTNNSSCSIIHAHCHIVNHNFNNENKIINQLNFNKVDIYSFFENKKKSYISYISPNFNFYITYNFKGISQQMRIYMAEDLNIKDKYNWRKSNFDDNILKTINLFKH